MENANKPQTFLGQIFSGFFLAFWLIITGFLAAALYSMYGNEGKGHDIGMGDGRLLFWFSVLLIAAVFVINYFHPEQKAKRANRSV